MKKLAMILVTFCSLVALAQTADVFPQPPMPPPPPPPQPPVSIVVQGVGHSNGICNGQSTSYQCFQDLVRRSEMDGQAATQQSCWERGGQGGSFAQCNTECNPPSLPPGAPNQRVACTSNCMANCLIH